MDIGYGIWDMGAGIKIKIKMKMKRGYGLKEGG
jgi:hypothetical protein